MTTIELPQLQGTEKQIAWAENIREQAISHGMRMAFPQKMQDKYGEERTLQIKNIVLSVAAQYNESKQWINYSQSGGKSFTYISGGQPSFLSQIVAALETAGEDRLAEVMQNCI